MRSGLRGRLAVVALASGAVMVASAGEALAITQVGLLIDSSASIADADFLTLRTGVANAAGQFVTDGSVEVTVVQFASTAGVVVGPTVINSPADRTAVVDAINGIDRTAEGGTTNYEAAFNLIASTLDFSGPDDRQFINMLTDGEPTNSSQTVLDGQADPIDATLAIAARDSLIVAGADLISFEAINLSVSAQSFLLDDLAYPQPGVLAPPFPNPITTNGFVVAVDSFADVEGALLGKFRALDVSREVPEPATAVLGLMGLGALMAVRRRRGD